MILWSEGHSHLETDAPSVGVGIVPIGDAPHVVNLDEFEDVVDADTPFDVRCALVHADSVLFVGAIAKEVSGKVKQFRVGIVERGRIVFVGELSPKHIDTQAFAPLEFLQQWDAIEEPSVEIPFGEEGGVAVVEKFEVGDEIEGVVLDDVGGIGCWMDEEGKGHFVPLRASLDVNVALAKLSKPNAFVKPQLGEVVVVLTS